MKFTLQQLKDAHARVKTGADFPRYIQEIKTLGLITYDYLVQNGVTVYHGADGHTLSADAIYPELSINPNPSPEALQYAISIHQQGQTDFLTFCRQAADAGVERWIIDTQAMRCSYRDAQGNLMVAEPIRAF